jgi:hypothetical protein
LAFAGAEIAAARFAIAVALAKFTRLLTAATKGKNEKEKCASRHVAILSD